nr:ras-related protein Rab5-like [Coffea arabica]XP_027096135.1 ras-related protein Rab5-like [Coffea arabica]
MKGAAACIIVYDITSKVSYERAKMWVEYMKRAASRWDFALPVMALAGNKVDLEDKRQVTTEDAKLFADQNGLIFMETSAKVETNIKELFFKIATTLAAQPVHAECVINLGDPCPAAEPSKSPRPCH